MSPLDQFLQTNVFHLILIFARLGTVFMLFPGISAPYVSPRARLALAMMVSFVVLPLVGPSLPPQPAFAAEMFLLVGREAFVGLFFGVFVQVLMTALHWASTTIGFNSGMANALVFDPISQQQGAMVNGFLGNIAVVLIFALDVHHLLIQAVVDSYTLFVPGQPLPLGDMSAFLVDSLVDAVKVGTQLAMPFITFTVIFYTALGLLNRLSPQMNVFFVGLPLQLLLSMGMLMLTIPVIMLWFMNFLDDRLNAFLGF